MLHQAVTAGLVSVGCDVVDIGIAPTPTVEIAVTGLKAAGGICVTASHNPSEWNALKFFNNRGEFITTDQYRKLNRVLETGAFSYKPFNKLGRITSDDRWVEEHIKKVLALKVVRNAAIRRQKYRVVVDAINGAGSQALPSLLERLGVEVVPLNCRGDGDFVHEPEPIPTNLVQLTRAVKKHKADAGLACDPDADRLALVDETGKPAGEELTLAIAVHEVLKTQSGPTVINLSTSSVTADAARRAGSTVYRSKVGEANVVEMMHRKKGVIGGEGNGGVIYPAFHAGRDSLIAAALVLSAMASEKKALSQLVDSFGRYYTVKAKGAKPDDFGGRLKSLETQAPSLIGKVKVNRSDGLRFDFDGGWVHVRPSNTEPIFRLIVETQEERRSTDLSKKVLSFLTRRKQ
jgi:phosphomannomutase